MEIPVREDYGMVWMGDPLMHTESNDMMMEHVVDSSFFVDPNPQILSEDDIRCRTQMMGMDGFMMLEDLDEQSRWYVNGMPEDMILENDALNSSKAVNIATQTGIQTAPPGSRKIKPVKHPGLKLQTPIAYQRDTDLNVIPIQKEGRAVCQKCGAIGVKHAFYTRERRYCSLACARGSLDSETISQDAIQSPSSTQWSEEALSFKQEEPGEEHLGVIYEQPHFTMQPQSQLPTFILSPDDALFISLDRRSNLTNSHDWHSELFDPFFSAAPTSCFPHAPMADLWHHIGIDLKVEVENRDSYDFCEEFPNAFWIASVRRVEGYKAFLRFEGFGDDPSKDFWVNLCSSTVHPVGWCADRGKPLIPPKSIKNKYSNWKEFLKLRLTGARTLDSKFYSKVPDSLKSRFRCDLTVEVVDKNEISQVKVATIEKIIGKRLQLRYYDSKPSDRNLFWCHEDSPMIHPVGWARRIGQKLDASPEYLDRMMKGLREKDDATADLFVTPERMPLLPNCYFLENMKLEAIDPLNLGDICVATVMQVLNDGYLMIRIDIWIDENPTTEDWFCCHMTSPCIFPVGFCASNGIPLTPPKQYIRNTFDWNQYLQETDSVSAPRILFNKDIPEHGFEVGMKLEAADSLNPRLICVATIQKVVGRLLKLHFDGWEDNFDQWVDCNSCDLYPVGWCELVSHRLEPPFTETKPIGHRCFGREKRKLENGGLNVSIDNECMKINRCDEEDSNSNCIYEESRSNINEDDNITIIESSETVILAEHNTCIRKKPKLIPRLSDYKSKEATSTIMPMTWDVNDVAEFLKINDCSTYCDAFIKQSIDGQKLMQLTKDEVLALVGMKVGPSLKIQNLITQLTSKILTGKVKYSRSSTNFL